MNIGTGYGLLHGKRNEIVDIEKHRLEKSTVETQSSLNDECSDVTIGSK